MTYTCIRSCSEICVDADNHSDDLAYLSGLWKEVGKNMRKYPIVELEFMKEHLQNYAREIARKDASMFKELFKEIFG